MAGLSSVLSRVEDSPEGWRRLNDQLLEGSLKGDDAESSLEAMQQLVDQSHYKDETLPDRLQVVITLASLDAAPPLAAMMLHSLREARPAETLSGKQLAKMILSLSSALPAVLRALYLNAPVAEGRLSLWEEVLLLRGLVEQVVSNHCSDSAVMIRVVRLLQMLVMCLTRKPTDEDSSMEDEEVTLDLLPRDGSGPLRHGVVREEASRLLDLFISLLWRAELPLGPVLAALNLLGRVARLRPFLLAKIVPALIGKFENPTAGPAGLEEHQRVFLEHTVERQLASLVECPAAEKYYPLIVEALKKSSKYSASRKRRADAEPGASAATGAPRDAAPPDEDDDSASTLANVGTKRIKSDAPLAVDIESLPLPAVIEIILRTLSTNVSVEQIRGALEQWRPSPKVRDPRRQAEEAAAVVATAGIAAPGVAEGPDGKVDQVVPFELAPRLIEPVERHQLLRSRLEFLLASLADATLLRDAGRRGSRIKSLLRLIALLSKISGADGGSPSSGALAEMVLDFCFDGEQLEERFPILMYWLGILWLNQNDGDAPVQDIAQPAAGSWSYAGTYELAMERLQDLVAHMSPQWDVYLQRFFSDAPSLLGDLHLTLLEWVCKVPATRLPGFAIIEGLVKSRPALRAGLCRLIYDFATREEDGALRKAAIAVATEGLFKMEPLRQDVIAFAQKLLLDATVAATPEEGGGGGGGDASPSVAAMDLPIRLALVAPEMLESILMLLDREPPAVNQPTVDHITKELLASAPLISPETLSGLCNSAIQEDRRSGILLGRLCEFLSKNSMHPRNLLMSPG